MVAIWCGVEFPKLTVPAFSTHSLQSNYPAWEPEDVSGSMYLNKMTELQQTRRLNKYGVLEGHEPSNLGDSFARAPQWQGIEDPDEGGTASQQQQQRQPARVLGLLNEFYDLNNKPNL